MITYIFIFALSINFSPFFPHHFTTTLDYRIILSQLNLYVMNSTTEKADVYTLVTNRIIAQLEQGVVIWKKPWDEAGLPQNLISKRPYRGINVWLLVFVRICTKLLPHFQASQRAWSIREER
jgi:hypothetical protein